jgi:hypothetical protein
MIQTSLDLSLFRWIESQTSESDRQALLSIREAVCSIAPSYHYLEVGSHLGGSLQPHVADARCAKIFSIDPRPLEQPDERWTSKYRYEGNSTERMLALLSTIPAANISKIQTFEASSWDLAPAHVSSPIDFAFIDGEHTNSAVVRDFVSVRRFLSTTSILAFHDCFVTPGAFLKISRMLWRERQTNGFLYYPDSGVVAIVFASVRLNEALLQFGWRKGLPYSHFDYFKSLFRARFPRVISVLRWCKHFCLGKQDS